VARAPEAVHHPDDSDLMTAMLMGFAAGLALAFLVNAMIKRGRRG
jgi:hypothetical protein